ncbi:beta-1,4-glucosidase, partial [Aureobasidium melanogenum]|uniref:beta-glucosidase n=1 Tax=Aureobasidium melanogenum (strain CBS 110374) TaxID=1043003 RepID=A0A074WRL2_AURM1
MPSLSSYILASAGASLVNAQFGNFGSPYPNTTYPGFESENPYTIEGSNSFQWSPPKYPSPWGEGSGDWKESYAKARALVSQLTLEEKVNLTSGVGTNQGNCVGQTGSVPRHNINGLCLQDSPVGVRLTDGNSVFPAGVNVAATWSRGLAYARGRGMGQEHYGKGVDMQLGPVAGPLGRAPAGGRNWEGFSPDPYLTGLMFAESIKGIQSAGVMTSAKHFIAYEQEHFRQSQEAKNWGFNVTESITANLDDVTLHELYLWPFADGIRAGATSIMCSYNQVNSSQSCQNSYILNHILKNELGFQGFVVSDWYGTHSGVSSILAGLDMSMPGDPVQEFGNHGGALFGSNMTIAVINGTVPQWRLDDAAVRILAAWYYVGRDKNQVPVNFNSYSLDTYGYSHNAVGQGYGLINQHVDVRMNHSQLIREIGSASTVLLKNVNNALPLTGKEFTVVLGEDAFEDPNGPNGFTDRAGDEGTLGMAWGSGSANFPYLVTPNTAIQNEVVGKNDGLYQSMRNNSNLDQAYSLAKQATDNAGALIIFANSDSGEGYLEVDNNFGDRNNLTFWQGADQLIANVSATCNNTILVIHSVGPVLIEEYANNPNITAILWAGVPGEQSGNSIADVLYGRVNPGAKLPFSMAAKRSDYGTDVLYTPNNLVPQANFKEGIFIDYRALDKQEIEPVYEFGFGLSYTNFTYSNIQVTKLNTSAYAPTTGMTPAAQTYGNISMNPADHVFPSNFSRVPLYLYPWINSTNLSSAAGESQYAPYGDNSFVPEGAVNSSPQPRLPASGPSGGNPALWDVIYRVTAQIKNVGKVGGDEVPQLYVSLGGPYDAVKMLRGFERLSIQPNQTVTFSADIMRRDIMNWSPEAQDWFVSNYTKTVYVGSSSRNLPLTAKLA